MNRFNLANAIVAKGKIVAETAGKPVAPVSLTEQQKKLVDFFRAKKPFDCQQGNASELVEILTGGFNPLKHITPSVVVPPLFSVIAPNNNTSVYGVVLGIHNSTVSYARREDGGYITAGAGYPNYKIVSPEEAKAFLDRNVSAWFDENIISWIVSTLGNQYLKPLYDALA